ncbi:hypothetical protein [Massilia sp. CF038]|nr:hypothetical protein [Massilia sp. CF038]SHG42207.1 hypothetical protein SAMN05428948_0404 [Massilia sp. CF038]
MKRMRDKLTLFFCLLPPAARIALIVGGGLLGYGVLGHLSLVHWDFVL